MSTTFERLKKYLVPIIGEDRSGVFSFRREKGGAITRFHLRIEKNGYGMLLANSSVACRLSPSGTVIAKLLLENKNENEIEAEIRKNFRSIPDEQLKGDVKHLKEFIDTLATPDDTYPIFNLQDPALEPPRSLIAPFHAQMNTGSAEKVNPILRKLWDAGIPHVTFQADSRSSIDEAIQNVQRAEDIGMICGIRASGSWLQQSEVMKRLALAGIDYIVAPVASLSPENHDKVFGDGDYQHALQSFKDCIQWEICPVVEVAVSKQNRQEISELLKTLESNGMHNVHCFVVTEPLSDGLAGTEIIQTAVDILAVGSNLAMRIIWLPPVSRTTNLQDVIKAGPRTAGDVSIFVDSDGNVFPSRGEKVRAGNVLNDPWKSIWSSEVFRKYRDRVESDTHCSICPGMEICAADCPADPKGWDLV
jgi:radical SAM protein with 4Fe4S-binding SPASM domain